MAPAEKKSKKPTSHGRREIRRAVVTNNKSLLDKYGETYPGWWCKRVIEEKQKLAQVLAQNPDLKDWVEKNIKNKDIPMIKRGQLTTDQTQFLDYWLPVTGGFKLPNSSTTASNTLSSAPATKAHAAGDKRKTQDDESHSTRNNEQTVHEGQPKRLCTEKDTSPAPNVQQIQAAQDPEPSPATTSLPWALQQIEDLVAIAKRHHQAFE